MVGIGNRDVERIANDIDGAGSDGEIDGGMAAIHDQAVVRLDEDDAADRIGDLLVDGLARGGDFVAMGGIVGLKAKEIGVALLVELPGGKPGHFVDVLLAVFPFCTLTRLCRNARAQVLPDLG